MMNNYFGYSPSIVTIFSMFVKSRLNRGLFILLVELLEKIIVDIYKACNG